jgi:transposase
MSSSPFLPLPTGLEIVSVETVEDLLKVQVASTKERAYCPLCLCPSERRHSHYTRVVADLPCAGFRVQLILRVRKFFCETVDCSRKIFDLSASSLRGALGTRDSSSPSSSGSGWNSHLWRGRHALGRTACPADLSYHSPSSCHGLAHRCGRLGQTVRDR